MRTQNIMLVNSDNQSSTDVPIKYRRTSNIAKLVNYNTVFSTLLLLLLSLT